ncbi:type I-E CRISPR-associated protein Cse1/CasA [Phytopseudomonas dryadis]|uniref:Type I-E CRISPR-associated protein Cse1/CasA n=1 Tax=Phytopseudomonas dryadis TaxID=2487520 RepID=A0A4Q9QYV0_9GAMM|nr:MULTISPECIES: type I-E CRISPR-associated protein Cse1/CasA [Pseudomonas]TBU90902.1 type I-E CRISPR-associated protein Cse1/CasA [Pseudomonas dryadis]TBV08942.1 type I-E CRISPR-associated protein Cse1/CasA [Pseudomonas dryadis]TBV15127.1 type I-E CRISPR-associated protein Cse1/CasA [Pseudomonas sp. FRB 230]
MSGSFSLLDEPWLAVRMHDGQVRELGLLELFERASEISALAETAPPSLIAQYRLLLAITHRALTHAQGRWTDSERLRWYRDGLPFAAIRDYLEHWRERFWLFHPQQPFMQVAALAEAEETRDKLKPWTQISLASANGNAPVVFDHSCDLAPRSISAADALCTLLGFLQFTPGGLVKTLRDSDKAGALANTAAVMPVGDSLARSLCLALHPPTQAGHEDLPSWEQGAPSIVQLRGEPMLAAGPNDRYSRQTRAVLLLPDEQGRVQWIRFAAGLALGDDLQAPDPMASYRAGSNSLVRLSFTEGRAFWRDLPALLPDAEGKASQPAAVLVWAANLQFYLNDSVQPLLVAGLASDQAKLLRWRSERIALPAALLAAPDYANELRRYVRDAEELFGALRKLAAGMLAEILPDPGSKDTWARARSLVDAGPAGTLFFASAERHLGRVMTLLGAGGLDEAEALWRRSLREAAQGAWQAILTGLGRSAKALCAEAHHYPRLLGLLAPLQDLPTPDKEVRA